MAGPIDWTTTVLCTDADLREFETDVLQWLGGEGSASKWRNKAKDLIAQRMDLRLKDIEIATDIDDVKDLIGNPAVLKDAACYRSLHLIANDVSQATGDLYDRKAQMYLALYEQEIEIAAGLLHIDIDESGAIDEDTGEMYAAPTGVRLKHGG